MPSTDAPVRSKHQANVPASASKHPKHQPKSDGRRNDTRDRLVVSALRMLNEKGYAGTTVAEIERAVGLRPGSGGLYRHFRSKGDLLLEAVRSYHERVKDLRAELAETADQSPAGALADELRDLVVALAGFLAGEGPMVRLSLETGGLPEPVRRAVGDAWDDGYGMLIDLLGRHGVEREPATLIAVSTLGSLNHYFTHIGIWHTQPAGVEPADFLEAWVDQVCVIVGDAAAG